MPWKGEGVPSLGWGLLEWFEQFPSPRDPSRPLRFSDEQALSIVDWYSIDPESGEFLYRRGFSRRAKGHGKSPVEAAKSIGEFCGPVRFAGWDANGEPVGRPWGTPGYDDPQPWVQVGAVSIDQTDNTWSVIYYFLTENDGALAESLGIDPGLTRCFLKGRPGAKMEPVTASAGSREGQPVVYAVLDETHLWVPSNGGVRLARTMRRNVAKIGGRSFETTNSFVFGSHCVAEGSWKAAAGGAPGIYADQVEAPEVVDSQPVNASASDETIRKALKITYGGSWWVDIERHIKELRDPDTDWLEWARFFLNWNTPEDADSHDGPIAPARWAQLTDGQSMATEESLSLGLDAPLDRRSACFTVTGRRSDGLRHGAIRHWVPQHDLGKLVETAKALSDGHHKPIFIPPKSPALAWRDDLVRAGVDVREVKSADFLEAQQTIEQAVSDGTFRHRGQPEMVHAVEGLAARVSGDTSPWSRRSSSVNVAPLFALAAAVAGSSDTSGRSSYSDHSLIIL